MADTDYKEPPIRHPINGYGNIVTHPWNMYFRQLSAYITSEDLDFAGDTGTGTVDMDSQTFTIAGTANEIETAASSQTLTIGLPDDVTIGNDLIVGNDLYVDDGLIYVNNQTYGSGSDESVIYYDGTDIYFGAYQNVASDVHIFAGTGDDVVLEDYNSSFAIFNATRFRFFNKLLIEDENADVLTLGNGASGIDYYITFNGQSNDGTITYMEDEDRFDFSGSVLVNSDITINTGSITSASGTLSFGDEKIGIGTTAVPHGGVGAAMIAVDAANASTAGPHVQFTTASDDYPLLQIVNWAHDIIYINFDAYYDGAWKSSDLGSNFRLVKTTDVFRLDYDSGIAAGSAIIWNIGLSMNTSGNTTANGTILCGGASPTLTLGNASINDSSGALSLNALNVSTTGTLAAGAITSTATSFTLNGTGNTTCLIDSSAHANFRIDKGAVTNQAFVQFFTGGVYKWALGTQDSDDWGSGDAFMIGTESAHPYFVIHPSSGVTIGSTIFATDSGANNLLVEGTVKINGNLLHDSGGLALTFSGSGDITPAQNMLFSDDKQLRFGNTLADPDAYIEWNTDATDLFVIRCDNNGAMELQTLSGSIILKPSETTVLTATSTTVTIAQNLFLTDIKSGATQVAAGAAANEVWRTSGHATLPDNVLMIGV